MKQIWPNYSYSPTTNVLTLTGLNIDRDQLLLVTAADRGRIMYNFADSSVTASAFTSGANTALTLVATTAGLTTTAALVIYYDDQLASTTVTVSSLPAISGTVTANLNTPNFVGTEGDSAPLKSVALGFYSYIEGEFRNVSDTNNKFPVNAGVIYGLADGDGTTFGVDRNFPVDIISALPTGTNRIGVVTIGGGTVTIGAGTAQIGSVTASISGTVPVSGTFFQATQPASLASLPALAAGTNQIGSVTASISGTVPVSISSVTVGNSITIGSALPAGTNRIGVVTIGGGTVTIGAGTAQIGSVTASISNSITISSLPAISGTVTANLEKPTWTNYSGTVVTANTPVTAISNTSRSYLLAQVTTGQMFLNIGATATTLNSVYFSAGQGFAWETVVPQGIVSIISAVTGTNYVLKEG